MSSHETMHNLPWKYEDTTGMLFRTSFWNKGTELRNNVTAPPAPAPQRANVGTHLEKKR